MQQQDRSGGDCGGMGTIYYFCWEGTLGHGGRVLLCGGRSGCCVDSVAGQRFAGATGDVRARSTRRVEAILE